MRKFGFFSLVALLAGGLFVSCSNEEDVAPAAGPQVESNDEPIINPAYVDVDWANTEVKAVNPDLGEYTFEATAETKQVQPGSLLAIDVDTTAYIVFVKEVKTLGNDITIVADRASLADIFANYEFVLTSAADEETRAAGKDVFEPVKILSGGEELEATRVSLNKRLLDFSGNYNGKELYKNGPLNVYFKEANYSAYLDVNLDLSFGKRDLVQTGIEVLKQYRSKSLWANAYLKGHAEANLTLQADIEGKAEYHKEATVFDKDIIIPITLKFMVDKVPVYITIHADMVAAVDLVAEGKVSAYTGAHASIDGTAGVKWSQTDGFKPHTDFSADYKLVPPTVDGRGHLGAQAWLFPRFYILLYDLAGFSVEARPFIEANVNGGFHYELLNKETDYCAWTFKANVGVDAAGGADLRLLNLVDKHFDFGNKRVFDYTLYESPVNIELANATAGVKAGETTTVTFTVKDLDIRHQEITSYLPQIVKFVAPGKLSSRYGIAWKGQVSVDWTPETDGDVLRAVLYNADGGVIKAAEFKN